MAPPTFPCSEPRIASPSPPAEPAQLPRSWSNAARQGTCARDGDFDQEGADADRCEMRQDHIAHESAMEQEGGILGYLLGPEGWMTMNKVGGWSVYRVFDDEVPANRAF
jgi:hypothetical protein